MNRMAIDLYMRVYEVEAKEAYKAVEDIERGVMAPVRQKPAEPPHDKKSNKKKRGLFGWW